MRRKRGETRSVRGAMMLPKDVTTFNQSETLTQLFVLLTSSLNPAIVPRMDAAPEIIPSSLGVGVRTAIETALISVCNRISDMVQEPRRWMTEDPEMIELYKMSLLAGIENATAGKKAAEAIQALSQQKPKRGGNKGPNEETK